MQKLMTSTRYIDKTLADLNFKTLSKWVIIEFNFVINYKIINYKNIHAGKEILFNILIKLIIVILAL